MAGLSLEFGDGALFRTAQEAPELTSRSNFFVSTEETDLHAKRTDHAEFTDKTLEAGKPMSLEIPKVAEEAVNASTSQTEGNSGTKAAVKGVVEHEDKPYTNQMPLGTIGKKLNKKNRACSKETRVQTHSSKQTPQLSNLGLESVEDGGSLVEERKQCLHLEKGVDLSKVLARIRSSEPVRCEDCRVGRGDRRGGKKSSKKSQKKGGNSSDLKSNSKAIWICLQCGHYVCGGIGLPTNPKNHALRHLRLTHHPLVIQYENPHLRWCFPCNTLIRVKKGGENGEQKDVFFEVVKLIKGHVVEGSSDCNVSESKYDDVLLNVSDGRDNYAVSGLVNLGNTCFFNSILQNLLAMDRLRDYFLKLEASIGPLTSALKKLFNEVRTESRTKSTVNPRSLFGSISSKAPQFKGYQQHDSHELLRVLLDGLHSEELGAKKMKSSNEDVISLNPSSTFVDEIFGGKVSSTVCCVECGHSSTVYESYLDLSLSVPTKKPLTEKQIARVKKLKPPKKDRRQKPIVSNDRSLKPQSSSTDSTSIVVDTTLISENVSSYRESKTESTDSFSWLDYLGPESMDDYRNFTLENDDRPNIEESSSEPSAQSCPLAMERSQTPDFSSRNSWENEVPLQVQGSKIHNDDQASSSNLGGSQDDFDGFVDLFYEPEVIVWPVARPLGNEVTESSCESDPDEVDNSDSRVTVESCLAYFTKLELLSGENGYNCERCSENLEKKRLEMVEKKNSASPKRFLNGHQIGNLEDVSTCTTSESLIVHDDKTECSSHNCGNIVNGPTNELHFIPSLRDGTKIEESRGNGPAIKSRSSRSTIRCRDQNSKISGEKEKSEKSEVEEMSSSIATVKRDATKRFLIRKAPPILTIHIKRFSPDARGRYTKLNSHVCFSEVIDLRPYMDSRYVDRERYDYRLIGVVEHSGSMRGGHYVSYVRGRKRSNGNDEEPGHAVRSTWYHVSDTHVWEVCTNEVLNCEAYILFYEIESVRL